MSAAVRTILRAIALVALLACQATATTVDWEILQRPGVHRIGASVRGVPIECARFGSGPDLTLYLGTFHGDEPAGADLLADLCDHLSRHPEVLGGRSAIVIPIVNPDGFLDHARTNAHGVDLNRNYPTRDWIPRPAGGAAPASEPETRMLLELLRRYPPSRIVSIHQPLREVNYDGPAAALAEAMARANGYPVAAYIGYPMPGSFGTYAGKERLIPTITLELPPEAEANREALLAALRFTAEASSRPTTDARVPATSAPPGR